MPRAIQARHSADPPAADIVPGSAQLLRKRTPLPQHGALPVDHIHSRDQNKRNAEEDRRRVRQMVGVVGAGDVLEEGRSGQRQHTGEEVAGPTVAAGRGCGVRPVRADHVVDGGHVDGVVRDADDGREDHGCDPGDWWARGGPSEADQSNG